MLEHNLFYDGTFIKHFGYIIQHICYNNTDFNRKILKILFKKLQEVPKLQDLAQYMAILKAFLRINDQFRAARI